MLRLGFYYHIPAISKQDGIYMPGYLGRFVESLADLCEQVVCFQHSPRPDELERMDYRIASPNVEWVNIGPHDSVMKRTIFASRYTRHVRSYAGMLDILLVRGPSPLLPAVVAASPVPTALLLVGDYMKGIDDLPQPRWRKESIRLWSQWNKWAQLRAARRSLTFVNSRVLYHEFKLLLSNLREVRTTTLIDSDFFERSDTCQSEPPYHLLYAGRMDRAKGLLQMAQAVVLLRERGINVVLDLVGPVERGDPILDELSAFAALKNIKQHINYAGYQSIGDNLFAFYRRADVYIQASLASEGFPRVIWEAMSQSVPVVATRVGSIPDFVDDAAELVEPRDVKALAIAIQRVIQNPERRRLMIRKGLLLARDNTLKNSSEKIINELVAYLNNRKENSCG
jgi:glycosyltransferase involved in cell wall biosynthesis